MCRCELLARLPRLKQLDDVAVNVDASGDECGDEEETDDDVRTAPATDVLRKLSGTRRRGRGSRHRKWHGIHSFGTTYENLQSFVLFSERELMFTFAICYRPSVCRLSVCRLSVCNVRVPYSGGSNFPQYFYGIRYHGYP